MIVRLRKQRNECYPTLQLMIEGTKIEQFGEAHNNKCHKFLGIMMDDRLDWSHHIKYVSNKVRKIIFSLSKIKTIFPCKLRLQLYKSLLIPHIEYGLLIYGNANQIGKVVKLHKWGIRTALNKKYNCHTMPLYKENDILNVRDLYNLKMLNQIRELSLIHI